MLLQVILAIIPIAWLIVSMTVFKMSGFNACGIGLIITAIECLAIYGLSVSNVVTGAIEGALAAIWPIGIIMFGAMFVYNLSLRTGGMDVIKNMLASVSNDKRIAALLLGWCFGNFMEGIAGFGTAVAIPAAMMVGLGFDPIAAAVICLIGNAASPAFGAIGTPTISAANTAGLDATVLSGPTALLLGGLCILSPFVIILLVGKSTKAFKGVMGITIASVISFYVPFYVISAFVGPELSVTIGALISLVVVVFMGRNSKAEVPEEYLLEKKDEAAEAKNEEPKMSAVKAWIPYVLIVIFILGSSKLVPPINTALGAIKSSFVFYSGEGGSTVSFSWINTPGVWMFLAGIIGGLIQGASVGDLGSEFVATIKKYWKAVVTVVFIVAIAKLMGYAGMVVSLANGLVALTGNFYPLIAPLIGGIGCFVTGSATSACVMFAKLQYEIAGQLGIDPYWLVAANSAGATAGKMISPQSIAMAAAAISVTGSDGKIMSATIKWCVLYIVIVCVCCYVGAIL
jgi:lactate permease